MQRPFFALILVAVLVAAPTFAQDSPADDADASVLVEAPADAEPVLVEADVADVVEADVVEADLVEPASIGLLRSAIESRAWPVVVGLVLVGLVYVLRRLGIEAILGGSAVLPWVTLALSVVGNLGAGLAAGVSVVDALWTAAAAAASAVLAWDLSGLFRRETDV